jgi:hypothetical protein
MHHEYEVETIDGDGIGHLVGEQGEYLIVEHGLLKSKHALPKSLSEIDEDEGVIRTTLSKHLVYDSPKVNGRFDREAVAEHYGLAGGFEDPPAGGLGDLEADDPAFAADIPLRDRIGVRQDVAADAGPLDDARRSPGVTGGDRRRDYPRDTPTD